MSDVGADGERPAAGADGRVGPGNLLSGTVHGPAVQAGSIHGDVTFNLGASPARLPVPGQLPPVPPAFVGRVAELAALDRLISDQAPGRPTTLAVVTGVGGVGKTSLVLRWLHGIRGRYPAGQLYADLGGHTPAGAARPTEVLAWFLRALGVPPEEVPANLDEQAGLYRSVTDGQRLIVMLDNAVSAAQVRALLPGTGPSLVVVTTRWRIAALAIDGARFTELGPLPEPDAIELLDRVAGPGRAGSEPDAARAVVRLCGRLPLAVCVTGARLAPHPSWPIGRIAGELADERDRLSALALTDDVSVRAAFDVSYQALPPEVAHGYRMLALIPGACFGADLAAAATGAGPRRVAATLDALTGASLLMEMAGDRFQFHDLVRLHACEQAEADPAAERAGVVARSVSWYLRHAVAADLVVMPGRWHLGPRYDQAATEPPGFAGPAAALAWLDEELPGLLAALRCAHDHALHDEAWQLCEALWGLFLTRKHFAQWISSHVVGIASARVCGHRRAEARLHSQLGYCYLNLRRYPDAAAQLRRALAIDRAEGHLLGEATALELLGLVDRGLGRLDAAIERFSRARDIHQELGVPRGIALLTRRIGEAHRDSHRYQDAIRELTQAQHLFAEIPDPFNEARALTGLGETLVMAGAPDQALPPLRDALATMTTLGSRYEQARIQAALGEATAQLGDLGGARRLLDLALQGYAEASAPEEAEIRQRQSALGLASGGPPGTASETDISPS